MKFSVFSIHSIVRLFGFILDFTLLGAWSDGAAKVDVNGVLVAGAQLVPVVSFTGFDSLVAFADGLFFIPGLKKCVDWLVNMSRRIVSIIIG